MEPLIVVPRLEALDAVAGRTVTLLVDVTNQNPIAVDVVLTASAEPALAASWILVHRPARRIEAHAGEVFEVSITVPRDAPSGHVRLGLNAAVVDAGTTARVDVAVCEQLAWTITAASSTVDIQWNEPAEAVFIATGPAGGIARVEVEFASDLLRGDELGSEKFQTSFVVENEVQTIPATGAARFVVTIYPGSQLWPFVALLFDDSTSVMRAKSETVTFVPPPEEYIDQLPS